jgi:hypothetical protein
VKQYWMAPELWPASTIVCIGGGPSLTREQVESVRGRARVIAINDAYKLAPWADVLYFCDCKWWRWHAKHLGSWQGLIVRLQGGEHDFGDKRIKVMRNMDLPPAPGKGKGDRKGGLSDQRDGLRTGANSGFQAIGLAVHLGAKRIVLLGYDMQASGTKTHWFGDHPGGTSAKVYDVMLPHFQTLVAPLAKRGIEIVNATPGSRLSAFPRKALAEALPELASA